MILDLTKDEAWNLYFEIGKAIDRHKSNIQRYDAMKCQQAVQVEESKLQCLEEIKKKINVEV